MFKFFTQKKWFLWSIGGTLLILGATWYQVQLDVRINEWFGEFYDTLQKALTEPNSVSEKDFITYLFTLCRNYCKRRLELYIFISSKILFLDAAQEQISHSFRL